MLFLLGVVALSCSPYRKMQKIRSGEVAMVLSVPDDEPLPEEEVDEIRIDSIRSGLADEPIIMNAE